MWSYIAFGSGELYRKYSRIISRRILLQHSGQYQEAVLALPSYGMNATASTNGQFPAKLVLGATTRMPVAPLRHPPHQDRGHSVVKVELDMLSKVS